MSVKATAEKPKIIEKYQTHKTDTGSPEVQVATISARILHLTEHFKTHSKDHGSRHGLMNLVSQRRSLLEYLKKQDMKRYSTLIESLELRK